EGPFTVLMQGNGIQEVREFATQQAAEFQAHHWLDNVCPVVDSEYGELEGMPLMIPEADEVLAETGMELVSARGNPRMGHDPLGRKAQVFPFEIIYKRPGSNSQWGYTQWAVNQAQARKHADDRLTGYLGVRKPKIVQVVAYAAGSSSFGPEFPGIEFLGGRQKNPVSKSDWGQLAFDAGKLWYTDPASEYVGRSRSGAYGLSKFMNNVGTPPRGKGITKAYLLKSFNEGYRAGGREYRAGKTKFRSNSYKARKRNPEPLGSESASASLYESFHGTPSTQITEVEEIDRTHDHLTQLGVLQSLKLDTESGIRVEIDFSKDKIILASDHQGRQLYFTGGNQKLSLSDLNMSGSKWRKDLMEIGKVRELTYRTKKKFDNFKTIDYFHGLGEESGVMPTLLFDTLSDQLKLAGGQYLVKPEG
ncbi:hypothetical protein LCGC14_2766250, partial [marine sediment metagenome]